MASSRVSPSPKRCQAKAGGGRGKGCQPSGLCILLKLFVGVVWGSRWGSSPSWPPGPAASSSASLQTLRSHLNTEGQGARWLGLLWKAPQTE